MDQQLARAHHGSISLTDPQIALGLVSALLYGQDELQLYSLVAYVVMPNHVHVLLIPNVPLPRITRLLKGYSARVINQILGRKGQLWQDESHDHWVRTRDELNRIIRYIEANPVAAGLVQAIEDWPWSSAATGCGTGIPAGQR